MSLNTGDNKSPGMFTLSLDLELAWGSIDQPAMLKKNEIYYKRTREVVHHLLELLVKYDISATWAVVGHLFLSQCKAVNGQKHPEIPRGEHSWYKADWFSHDPATDYETDPIWYAPDLIQLIQEASVPQEIGSHSFAHTIIGSSGTRRETVKSELEACVSLARECGVTLKSFVFPRNSVGYLEELKQAGFIAYRGPEQVHAYQLLLPKVFRRVTRFADQFFGVIPPVNRPHLVEGLVNVPGSTLYLSRDGFRKLVPISARVRKARKGIQQAIATSSLFHLWFHPFNLATDLEALFFGLEAILAEVARQRDAGRLVVRTMAQIAASELAIKTPHHEIEEVIDDPFANLGAT